MKKTLGGNRLGSGKKMQVELHGFERSTHDLGYLWRSTMSAGTLVPFLNEIALPGDTFDIELDCDVKTLPTIGPLFGSYKVQLDVFQTPIRLYNALLHNNQLGIGLDMSKVMFPVMKIAVGMGTIQTAEDVDNCQVNPSALLSYLGIRGLGNNDTEEEVTRTFNAIPLLAYWDIYKNYYANKQEPNGYYIHQTTVAFNKTVTTIQLDGTTWTTGSVRSINNESIMTVNYTGGTPDPQFIMIQTRLQGMLPLTAIFAEWTDIGTAIVGKAPIITPIIVSWRYRNSTDPYTGKPQVTAFPLDNIDLARTLILQQPGNVRFTIDGGTIGAPYDPPIEYDQNFGTPLLSSQEGLGLKTYQSDLFNNWLQTEYIDGTNGINQITAIDTSTGKFTIDTLNLSKKVYDMLNRIAVSGGTYDDWLDAVYAHDRYTKCETPMYMGGLSKELVFQEVISNSETADQPLGTLAGRGRLSDKHKGGNIVVKVDEPSYIMGIISLTPRIDYSQGNKWDTQLETMNDLHKPNLDEIGFQELITEQLAWWDTKYDLTTQKWITKSAGKQPAWINYMTNVNQIRGNFAMKDNQMFMTLNRRYEYDETTDSIKDLTTYIDPSKFNFIFAETQLDAQNFWTQISVDITARRKMSAKLMPNL